jgi:hypothetical protein
MADAVMILSSILEIKYSAFRDPEGMFLDFKPVQPPVCLPYSS